MKRVFQIVPAGSSNRSHDALQDGKNGPEEDNGVDDGGLPGSTQPDYGREGRS